MPHGESSNVCEILLFGLIPNLCIADKSAKSNGAKGNCDPIAIYARKLYNKIGFYYN